MVHFVHFMRSTTRYISSHANFAGIQEVLAQHFFVIWVTMENLIATMRRSGFARNQLVFVDGSSLDITHDSFIKACLSDPDISDPSIVARSVWALKNKLRSELFQLMRGEIPRHTDVLGALAPMWPR